MSSQAGPLSLLGKAELALRVWQTYARVRAGLKREPLSDVVKGLAPPHSLRPERHSPPRLSRAVDRSLRIGGRRPPCLVKSLVLFHLLRSQGDPAELVVGLPRTPAEHFAHAWVELHGVDVGPPPGRGGHLELARFG
jgi:hypothetical protein